MKKISVLLFLVIATSVMVFAQWSNIGGPAGEGITSLAVRGNFVFAGALSGVIYRSSDKGASWTNVFALSGNHARIIVDDNILYAATEGGGLFRSTNDGNEWTNIKSNLPTNYISTFCALGSDIFVGTSNGLYHSSNTGGSWSPVTTGATGTNFNSVVISNSLLAAASGSELIVSTNKGTSWTPANSGMNGDYIKTLTLDGSVLYAGSSSNLYRSTNNGAEWNKIGPSMLNIECVLVNNGTHYVGSIGSGVYRSTDNGANFLEVNGGMLSNNIRTIAFAGDVLLAGDYEDGLYRSLSNGNSWELSNKGLRPKGISILAISHDVHGAAAMYAGASSVSSAYNSLIRSTDNGISWTSLVPPVRMSSGSSLAAVGATVLVGGENGYVGRSNDSGTTWKLLPIRMNGEVKALHIRKSTLLAGFDWYGVYRSTNNGESWDTTSFPYQTYKTIYAIASNDERLFMCTREGFYRSSDDGKTWVNKSTGLPSFLSEQSMTMAAVHDTVIIAGDGEVFRSTDGGENWTTASSGLPLGKVWSLVSSGSTVYAVVNEKGIYRSTDLGKNWMEFNEGLSNKSINSLGVSNSELFAGSHHGVWKRSVGITSISRSAASSVLEDYSLDQNFPNPFNPSTTVSYHLLRAGRVSIKIYDLLGKEIATLVDEQHDAGSYSVRWDARDVSSGTYLMRMASDSYSETKRIVLLR